MIRAGSAPPTPGILAAMVWQLACSSSSMPTAAPCDETRCAESGGQCTGDVCEIDCESPPCRCPAEMSCQIEVAPADDNYLVDCSRAEDCRIQCAAGASCTGLQVICGAGECTLSCDSDAFQCTRLGFTCGTGRCELRCSGNGNCQSSFIDCGTADECNLDCKADACGDIRLLCSEAALCVADCESIGNNTCRGAALQCQDTRECDLACNESVALCE